MADSLHRALHREQVHIIVFFFLISKKTQILWQIKISADVSALKTIFVADCWLSNNLCCRSISRIAVTASKWKGQTVCKYSLRCGIYIFDLWDPFNNHIRHKIQLPHNSNVPYRPVLPPVHLHCNSAVILSLFTQWVKLFCPVLFCLVSSFFCGGLFWYFNVFVSVVRYLSMTIPIILFISAKEVMFSLAFVCLCTR